MRPLSGSLARTFPSLPHFVLHRHSSQRYTPGFTNPFLLVTVVGASQPAGQLGCIPFKMYTFSFTHFHSATITSLHHHDFAFVFTRPRNQQDT